MAGLAHLGIGFAGRVFTKRIHLIWLLIASMWLDLFYMVASAFGMSEELTGFLSHSLIAALAWFAIWLLAVWLVRKDFRSAMILALVVFSHWALDVLTWPMTAVMEDTSKMPLGYAENPSVGFGLYRSLAGVILGESLFLLGGIAAYIWTRRSPKGREASSPQDLK